MNFFIFFGYIKIGDNMKAKNWIIILGIFIALALGIYFIFFNKGEENSSNSSNSNYSANRTSSELNNTNDNDSSNNNSKETENKDESNNENKKDENIQIENNKEPTPPIETEISSFTTKIMNKDKARQNNIAITCNSLNDTLVENGQTFSFCNTVGQATTSKGYQKAEIFDNKR